MPVSSEMVQQSESPSTRRGSPSQTVDLGTASYAELKRIVKAQGLLEKQHLYYTLRIASNFLLLALGLSVLVIVDNPWIQVANAAYLAFVTTQIGLIGHDAGHRQITRSSRMSYLLNYLHGNILMGISAAWWIQKHNDHHGKPNQLDADPDIEIPFLAFSQEQAIEKKGIARFVVKHQAFLFWPLLLFEAVHLRIRSIQYVLTGQAKHSVTEAVLITAHIGGYIGLLFLLPNLWSAIAFLIVHQALFGLYMGNLFAPNHKGMLVLGPDDELDFLRQQVLTSRNVTANWLTNYLYGGLNFQIEHHLFPSMPANNNGRAQKIVSEYCAKHGISYHVTSLGQSYREILGHLHEVGAPLRTTPETAG